MLVNLLNDAPRTEPLLRIYENYMAFNTYAAELLGLAEGAKIFFALAEGAKIFFGREDRTADYLYVGKANMKQSYVVQRRGNTFVLYNAPLARKVASWLEGVGSYRICPEDKISDGAGNSFYNIFKKKYGKDK